jgi:hypothetical protein
MDLRHETAFILSSFSKLAKSMPRLMQQKTVRSSSVITIISRESSNENANFECLLSQACKLEEVVLVEEAPVAFPKDVLFVISMGAFEIGMSDLHMGIAKREITT